MAFLTIAMVASTVRAVRLQEEKLLVKVSSSSIWVGTREYEIRSVKEIRVTGPLFQIRFNGSWRGLTYVLEKESADEVTRFLKEFSQKYQIPFLHK